MKTILVFSLLLTLLGIWIYIDTNQPAKQLEIIQESIEPYDMTIEAWIERNK